MSHKSWQDKRRIRRLAVLLLSGREAIDEPLSTAAELDRVAAINAADRDHDAAAEWQQSLEAARYYLREMGRTKGEATNRGTRNAP